MVAVDAITRAYTLAIRLVFEGRSARGAPAGLLEKRLGNFVGAPLSGVLWSGET